METVLCVMETVLYNGDCVLCEVHDGEGDTDGVAVWSVMISTFN
jgi:hypothetical protein